MKFTFKKIAPGDERNNAFSSFNIAELKTLYNALLIDCQSDGEPGQQKEELLERLLKLIE